jgi:LlaJI restriction endonuclease
VSKKISYYVDGCPIDSFPTETRNILLQVGAFDPDESVRSSVSFTGVVNTHDGVVVVLPKTTNLKLPAEQLRECSKTLFQALIRFSQTSDANLVGETQFFPEDLIGVSQIPQQILLIKDWFTHGVYKSSQQRSRFDFSGRIDWKATLGGIDPFFSSDRPVYPFFVISESLKNSVTLIAQIHRWAIAQCDRNIGWLVAEANSESAIPELLNVSEVLPCSNETAVRALRDELRIQYDARKVWLLKSLIKIIHQASKLEGRANLFGMLKFWRVWETICRAIIDDSNNLPKFQLPQPLYIGGVNGSFRSSSARQVPDILLMREEKMIVVDAKYYDVARNLPGWADIVKQFYYAKTISHAKLAVTVENYFLFPEPTQGNEKPLKVILTFHRRSSEELSDTLNREFPPIRCEYINIYQAMRCYLNGDQFDFIALRSDSD